MENNRQCVRTRGEFEFRTHFLRIITIAICGIIFLGIKEVKAGTLEMSSEQAEYIYNWILNSGDVTKSTGGNPIPENDFKSIINKITSENIKEWFNNNIETIPFTDFSQVNLFLSSAGGTGASKNIYLQFYFHNSTIGNELGFLEFSNDNGTGDYSRIKQRDGNVYKIIINLNDYNGSLSTVTPSISTSISNAYLNTYYTKTTPEINNENSKILNLNYQLPLGRINDIYYDGNWYYFNNYAKFNTDGTIGEKEELPSGETSGDTSGDTESGDYTGQLNNINNSINTQGQTIINNQNENTNKIINTISGEVEKIVKEPESGEIESYLPTSGEILRKMNISPAIDPYESFWQNFIIAIREYLLNDTNISIEWQIGNYIITLNSQDFFVKENPLKNYTNTVLTALIVYNILKLIRKITEQINEGNFINVMHLGDADLYFF